MAEINYDKLSEIVERNLAETVQTKNFNFGKFLTEMEQGFIAHGFRENYSGVVDNILIIKLDAVGDFILSTPAIREIRMNYPHANITLIVSKNVYPVAERCPYVNEIIPLNVNLTMADFLMWIYQITDFAKKYLWRRHFTIAFDFRYFNAWKLPNMLMNYLSGAKMRVGYLGNVEQLYYTNNLNPNDDESRFFYTHGFYNPKEIISDCARNLYLLTACGLKIKNTELELWFDFEDKIIAKKLLSGFAQDKIKIIVGIGANAAARKYPVEKYLYAFRKIISKGAAMIILGGPSESADAKFLQEHLPADSVLNLVELQLNWRTVFAITELADMYIGNDTGTMHVSAANKLPVIYLSRVAKDRRKIFPNITTEREMFFPWQTKTILLQPDHQLGECAKIPSYLSCSANNAHCIAQINPKEIVAAYDKMIDVIKSDIKEIKCPPIIRSINQNPFLYSENLFEK